MSTPPVAELVRPAVRYQASYLSALVEFQATDQRYLDLDPQKLAAQFGPFVADLLRREQEPKPGRVPETVFWLVIATEFIGRVSVRHTLNAGLGQIGGHLGYEIRPRQRRRGYGTLICKLGLDYARQLGLQRVLITCAENNQGSRKVIEANGGKLEQIVVLPYLDVPICRYWVPLAIQQN